MKLWLERLGRALLKIGESWGRALLFWGKILLRCPKRNLWKLLCEQFYMVGVLSLPIIIVAGFFLGMVLGLQGYNILQRFGAVTQLGQLVALSVARELGPVLCALLFVGRAGSALTAEIGLMQATEQLESMSMMAVDPLRRVIFPRLFAGILTMPLLTAVFSIIAIWGGHLVGVNWLGVDDGQFWANMQAAVSFRLDIVNSLIKGVVFGLIATGIAVYQGYFAVPTAAGIGKATTRTVVYGSLLILGVDFILTSLMLGVW